MFPRRILPVLPALLCGVLVAGEIDDSRETREFDKGEREGKAYKIRKPDKDKKKGADKKAKAISYHVKNLKDPDPEVRASSAEMLGMLGAASAVPELIDVLRPGREDKVMVLLSAHGALVRLTGKNFGYKNYDEWIGWWNKDKEEFLKKASEVVDENTKIAAAAANSAGMQLMKTGQFAAAQVQFLDAVTRDPAVPDYKNNLGLCVMNQGRFLDAMEYFRDAISVDAALPQPYMNMGRCYEGVNKRIEAESWYKKAMETDKEGRLWEPFWMLGRSHMRAAEWNIAYEYLDQARVKAEKQNVHDPRLHKDLAICHFGLDQYHSAWKEIKNVETLGYDCDKGFVAKVRKALVDQGVDPDAEDKLARDVQRGAVKPDEK